MATKTLTNPEDNLVLEKAFANVEPLTVNQWWVTAWEGLHDPTVGGPLSADSPPDERHLWIVVLRNLHAIYESRYFDWEYDHCITDDWNRAGFSWADLASALHKRGLISDDVAAADEDDSQACNEVRSALRHFCFERHEVVYGVMLKQSSDDQYALTRRFFDSRTPPDSISSVMSWVYDEFGF